MSVRVDLQAAPELLGVIATPSAWAGASTSVVTVSGLYRGRETKTYTFTGDSNTRTIGTDAFVDWIDGFGQAGRLDLGTSYVAGTAMLFHDGMLIAFAAGNIAGTDSFTLVVTGWLRLPPDFVRIPSVEPTVNNWTGGARRTSDVVSQTANGDMRTTKIANNRAPAFDVDWLTADMFHRLLRLEARRGDWTIGEDYDENTCFLWRAGGLHPMIGPAGAFARASAATYYDSLAGLHRSVATGVPRVVPGLAGKAVQLSSAAVTNLLPRFHAKSSALAWSAGVGAPVVAWDEGHPTILDQADTHWVADFTRGTLRAQMPAASSITSDDATVALAGITKHTATAWLDGRGKVTVHIRSGIGAASTSRASVAVTLDGVWTLVSITGDFQAADTRGDISIVADEASLIYVGPAQLEAGFIPTSLVQTNGATATRALETLNFPFSVPADVGTMAIRFYWPGLTTGIVNNTATIVQGTGLAAGGRFALWYNEEQDALQFYTITPGGGPLNFTVALTTGWHHVVATWARSGTAGQLVRAMYVDRVLVAADATTAWGTHFGTGIDVGGPLAGNQPFQDLRVETIRIDDVAWGLAQVQDSYDRLIDADWLHILREFGGRQFLLAQHDPQWMDFANLDKIISRLQFIQSRTHDDALVVAR